MEIKVKATIILLTFFMSTYVNAFEYKWQDKLAKKEAKNIADYFNLVPGKFIDCEGAQFGDYDSVEKRTKIIDILDIKNGYIEFYSGSQLVLFKDRVNQRDIIGIQSGKCGAGTNCGGINGFYTIKGNEWTEVKNITPFNDSFSDKFYTDEICPYYDLPRFGLKVKLMNEYSGKPFKSMTWKNNKFILD